MRGSNGKVMPKPRPNLCEACLSSCPIPDTRWGQPGLQVKNPGPGLPGAEGDRCPENRCGRTRDVRTGACLLRKNLLASRTFLGRAQALHCHAGGHRTVADIYEKQQQAVFFSQAPSASEP